MNLHSGSNAVITAAERAALTDLATHASAPERLPEMPMASFSQARTAEVFARRALLNLGIPPHWLARIHRAVPVGQHGTEWDRWLSEYSYWHVVHNSLGKSETWRRLVRGPTVLLYHGIGKRDEPASRFVLPLKRFEQHMTWLRSRRYNVLGLDALLGFWHGGRLPPPRSVVVTLDDAYADAYENAFPILARLRIPATVFVVTKRVGGINDWERYGPLAGRPLAEKWQLQAMRDGGIQLGAHSRTHVSLRSVSSDHAEDEIVGSRRDLEQMFSCAVTTFAYPFGHNNTSLQETVRRAGFLSACDVVPAVADPWVPRYAIPRVEIHGTWRLLHVVMALLVGHVPRVLAA